MTARAGRAGRRLVSIAGPFVVVGLLIAAFLQSSRSDQISRRLDQRSPKIYRSQVAGCERGLAMRHQIDRLSADVAVLKHEPKPKRMPGVACAEAYPKPPK